MTIQPRPAAGVPDAPTSWRLLASGLWVARREGRHLGTVQRGRRWLAADADSEPIGVFHTFAEAQAAVERPAPDRVTLPGRSVTGLALVVAAGLLVLATTCATAWTSAVLVL